VFNSIEDYKKLDKLAI